MPAQSHWLKEIMLTSVNIFFSVPASRVLMQGLPEPLTEEGLLPGLSGALLIFSTPREVLGAGLQWLCSTHGPCGA